VIAASTGGPQAINTVLRKLPADFPSPILVVQHISHGFLQGLVHWLERECKLKVQIASHGEAVRPGHIYFAPTQRHMELRSGSLFLTDAAPLNGCKPSADVLFSSAARAGGRVIAIVLTGMGADGLEGSRALNRSHHAVLAQSPRSCAVAGMPSAVIEAGQATQVLDLEGIAEEMCRLAQV
jgi:two-component system chemotaxis response regulator CheB